jgi:AraC-like DNA-binding protein/mannose-6-phosphate isomerase-like protein (cupin superfamily)
MNKLVKDYLYNHNSIEKQQLLSHEFVSDLPMNSYENKDSDLVLLDNYFLKNDQIFISKHNRFAPYPSHKHRFLELNYVLSGTSHQIINGRKEVIRAGEILLLDKNTTHSLGDHGENDIVINIIFPNNHVDIDWLANMNQKDNVLFNFLIQKLTTQSKNEYIIFHSSENEHIQTILAQMIDYYFTGTTFSNNIISLYIPILFTELIGNTTYDFHHETQVSPHAEVMTQTLKIIDEQFTTITLETLAEIVGYNKNYLSNLVKKQTGFTFSQLVTQQRMKHAKFLIESTSLPINQIIERVGLANKSHFYTLFKKEYHELPTELRK